MKCDRKEHRHRFYLMNDVLEPHRQSFEYLYRDKILELGKILQKNSIQSFLAYKRLPNNFFDEINDVPSY